MCIFLHHARLTQSWLAVLIIAAAVPGNGKVCCRQDHGHHEDPGSRKLDDRLRSLASNQWEQLFRGLPDEVRLKMLEKWERQIFSAASDAEQGRMLTTVANELLQLRQFESANRVFQSVGANEKYSPGTRSYAWRRAGDMTYLDQNLKLGQHYFQKAAEVIEAIPEADRTWADQQHLLDSLAKLANCIQCENSQSDELPLLYRRLLELEPTHGDANRSRFLAIGLDAARTMKSLNDAEEAAVYWRLVEKYVEDSLHGVTGQLTLIDELTSGLYRWNDPARIEKLQKVWDDERFQAEPDILKLGNQILWARFLQRDAHRPEFEAFAGEMIQRGQSLSHHSGPDWRKQEDVSVYTSQAMVALAGSRREDSPRADVAKLKQRFQEMRGNQRVVARFPGGVSREELKTLHDAFHKVIRDVFEIDLDTDATVPPPAGHEHR